MQSEKSLENISSTTVRIAAVQLCSGVDIKANLEHAGALIRAAAAGGAELVVTPEMTHILQRSPKRLFAAIAPQDEDIGVAFFSDLARELKIYLLIGSLAIRTAENRAANRSFLFGPDGLQRASYDKIHLFDVRLSRHENWAESNVYDRGEQGVVADIEFNGAAAKLGLSICYDVRFAKLYRSYAQAGAQIMSVPAAFTVPTGRAHWETLLRARAIETCSFIIAPAQGGVHEDGRTTYGHSLIIGPWGDICARIEGNKPGFICADIDLGEAIKARAKVPAWQHDPSYSMLS